VVLTRNKDGKLIFDLSHYEHEEKIVAPPTPIRKRRSIDFLGSVIVRGRIPAPAATRTAEYSPRKRSRVDIRVDTYEFEMPPACRVVGKQLIFPSEADEEVGDFVMEEPKFEVAERIVRWRVTGDRRRVTKINRESNGRAKDGRRSGGQGYVSGTFKSARQTLGRTSVASWALYEYERAFLPGAESRRGGSENLEDEIGIAG